MRIRVLVLLCLFSVTVFGQEAADPPVTDEPPATENSETPTITPRLSSALPRNKYPPDEKSHMQTLAKHLPEDGLVWVEHYPEPFLAYWQPDRSGIPKGALLILHAEGANPVWQNTTRPLHESLPDYGWATFAIALPNHDAKPIPKRSIPVKTAVVKIDESDAAVEADQPSEESENDDQIAVSVPPETEAIDNTPPALDVIDGRLESALRFLHDQGQFNIVIMGSGVNAVIAQQFSTRITPKIENANLQGQLEKPIRAMVLVNSKNKLPTAAEEFVEWFSDAELPVLDVFFEHDPRNQHYAKQRKRLAKQKNLQAYQQVALKEISSEHVWRENKLSRRIRSFLEKNASGVEVRGGLVR